VVETVTLRAAVESPTRMSGSCVMRSGSGSISGTGAGSPAVVVGHSEVARRGRVAGRVSPSCALDTRVGETRAQESSVAVKSLWKEERIGVFRLVNRTP
jgi:hypothetical protein